MVKTRAPAGPADRASSPGVTPRLTVETPEHVLIRMELAGVGSRAAAALLDVTVIVVLELLLGLSLALTDAMSDVARGWVAAVGVALGFAILWGYFTLFEALGDGRTPGKRWMGLRVVMAGGYPVTFGAAAIRNLVRIVDIQPLPTFLVGLLFVLFHPHNRRLGDLVAGTVVVRDRPDEGGFHAHSDIPDDDLAGEQPVLTDDEYRLLDGLVARLDALDEARRVNLVRRFVARIADRVPLDRTDRTAFLLDVYARERRRRRSRFAVRRDGASGRTVMTGERFVARQQDEWEAFRSTVARAQQRGVGSLDGDEVVALAGAYRAVSADLARARTYGVDGRVLESLERTVAAGHNLLYRGQRRRRVDLRVALLRTLPLAAYRGRAYVALSFLIFALPGMAGFFMMHGNSELARDVLPEVVLARAEAGAEQDAGGRGYAETPAMYLPLVASSIIANNVQVAFAAFAFGVTAGVGTVLVLAFNGLFFGAVVGAFANYGLAGWLLTFVAGHGVLELFAIFVAGGAGLVVARAVLVPGDYTRRDALAVRGRQAIQMLGGAVALLLLAGIIEGFVSASDAPAGVKYVVSAASLALLALLAASARQGLRGEPAAEPGRRAGPGA